MFDEVDQPFLADFIEKGSNVRIKNEVHLLSVDPDTKRVQRIVLSTIWPKPVIPSVHPLSGEELRALRALRREHDAARYVFMTERGSPMSAAGFRKMLARTGKQAKFRFLVHPHMLRHACGFKLANDGQDTRALQHYLGHKNIQHTVRYTELSPERFKNFWE